MSASNAVISQGDEHTYTHAARVYVGSVIGAPSYRWRDINWRTVNAIADKPAKTMLAALRDERSRRDEGRRGFVRQLLSNDVKPGQLRSLTYLEVLRWARRHQTTAISPADFYTWTRAAAKAGTLTANSDRTYLRASAVQRFKDNERIIADRPLRLGLAAAADGIRTDLSTHRETGAGLLALVDAVQRRLPPLSEARDLTTIHDDVFGGRRGQEFARDWDGLLPTVGHDLTPSEIEAALRNAAEAMDRLASRPVKDLDHDSATTALEPAVEGIAAEDRSAAVGELTAKMHVFLDGLRDQWTRMDATERVRKLRASVADAVEALTGAPDSADLAATDLLHTARSHLSSLDLSQRSIVNDLRRRTRPEIGQPWEPRLGQLDENATLDEVRTALRAVVGDLRQPAGAPPAARPDSHLVAVAALAGPADGTGTSVPAHAAPAVKVDGVDPSPFSRRSRT